MYIFSYQKMNGKWFLEKPSHAKHLTAEDLERKENFHYFLELASEGNLLVRFYVDFKPFPGADQSVLKQVQGTEAIYEIIEFEGRRMDLRIRMNRTVLAFASPFPPAIFFRRWH